jgi:hypothetical protein
MSEYPKKLVSDAGGVAMVNDAKDEATLKERGYKETAGEAKKPETKPRKPSMRSPQLPSGPKKRKP